VKQPPEPRVVRDGADCPAQHRGPADIEVAALLGDVAAAERGAQPAGRVARLMPVGRELAQQLHLVAVDERFAARVEVTIDECDQVWACERLGREVERLEVRDDRGDVRVALVDGRGERSRGDRSGPDGAAGGVPGDHEQMLELHRDAALRVLEHPVGGRQREPLEREAALAEPIVYERFVRVVGLAVELVDELLGVERSRVGDELQRLAVREVGGELADRPAGVLELLDAHPQRRERLQADCPEQPAVVQGGQPVVADRGERQPPPQLRRRALDHRRDLLGPRRRAACGSARRTSSAAWDPEPG
jgi:hypothetical protein